MVGRRCARRRSSAAAARAAAPSCHGAGLQGPLASQDSAHNLPSIGSSPQERGAAGPQAGQRAAPATLPLRAVPPITSAPAPCAGACSTSNCIEAARTDMRGRRLQLRTAWRCPPGVWNGGLAPWGYWERPATRRMGAWAGQGWRPCALRAALRRAIDRALAVCSPGLVAPLHGLTSWRQEGRSLAGLRSTDHAVLARPASQQGCRRPPESPRPCAWPARALLAPLQRPLQPCRGQ